ncbi:MAG: hypothetical protein LUC45_06905 [Paraprevotella sp.]|nr:hypothetical protein [Paraprevotella sp.]
MDVREKILWQIANTVMVNHQFIDTPDFCAEQAQAALFLFQVSLRLDADIYRDFALRNFERCVSRLSQMSQKVVGAGWPVCRILNEEWMSGNIDEILQDVDRKIIPALSRNFDFGDEVKGSFILPHFYLLERYRKDNNDGMARTDILQNLKKT